MRHPRLLPALVALLLLLASGADLAGQTARIGPGQSVQDRLTREDRQDGARFYHQYAYTGGPGEEIEISLTSSEFDAYLQWGTFDGGLFTATQFDDDGGDGTNSLLRLTVPPGGYALRVTSFSANEIGAYSLVVTRVGGAPASSGILFPTIMPGETIQGELDPATDILIDSLYYTDVYQFIGAPGEEIIITLRSTDFDSYLIWLESTPTGYEVLAEDDDSGGNLDSQIRTRVGTGSYEIEVTTLNEFEFGRYTLSIERVGGAVGGGGAPAGGGGPPPAGGVRTVSSGQTISDRLTSGDPTLADGSHFHLYEYRGTPGEPLVITLRSPDFDAYLSGGTLQGTELNVTSSNDDGAGGTDSRLTVAAGADGRYGIRVNTFSGGATGNYTLEVLGSGGAVAGSGSRVIRAGDTVPGRLANGDPQLPDGSFYHEYTYEARAGEQVIVNLTSGDFDTFLIWGSGSGNGFTFLASDDDGGGGTNSLLDVRAESAGTYSIRVNSYAAGSSGAYSLSVQSPRGTGLPTIALGQTISDRLTPSDPTLSDNSHYKLYLYQGTPGEQILITMRSGEVDAYLSGGRVAGDTFTPDATDDDSGGGRDAQLLATVASNGTYGIRANTYGAGETGAFTLTVQPIGGAVAQQPPAPAGAVTIAAGDRISGALRPSDPILGDSSYYNQYVYRGTPGDRLRITLTSSDFDTYLRWGRLDGGYFTSEAFDDDGAGGTNSMLEVTVSGTGVYAIQANSYAAGMTGNYTLTVERMAAAVATPSPGAPTPSTPTPTPAPTPTASGSGLSGKWVFAYVEPSNPNYRPLGQAVKQWAPLEDVTDVLNRLYPLPRNVDVRIDECGFINAFYRPSGSEIVFCYELVQHLANTFATPGLSWDQDTRDAIEGALRFILWHEIGHALVHQLDLPITGREEDAVDQLAALMLIGSGEKGAQAALSGVIAIQPDNNNFEEWEFAGEHSLGPQRLYNIACWIYGSNPQRYSGIVSSGMLPESRAVRCPGEYDRLQKAWTRILQPHTAD